MEGRPRHLNGGKKRLGPWFSDILEVEGPLSFTGHHDEERQSDRKSAFCANAEVILC